MDDAQRFPATSLLSMLCSLTDSNQLYTLKDKKLRYWPEVKECNLGRGRLSRLFWEVRLASDGIVGSESSGRTDHLRG